MTEMKKYGYIILILTQFISILAFAQNQQLKFERIGAKEGLSDLNVVCMMQDSRGFIWVGTRNGLSRFDGHQFKVFYNDPADSGSLNSGYIKNIIEDSKGNMWIATSGGGFNKLDRKKNRFKLYLHNPDNPNSVSGNYINKIVEDKTGNLWIATDKGVNFFDPETNQFIHFFSDKNDPTTISDNKVSDIFADSRGDIWLGTQGGGLNLFVRENSTFIRFQTDSSKIGAISGNYITTIFEGSRHRLWIGTAGDGLNLFDRKTGKFRHFKNTSDKNSLCNNKIQCIAEDDNGNLWIGTENGGISLLDSTLQNFRNYSNDEVDNNSLSTNSIHSITKDKEGNMWVGVFAGGINLYKKNTSSFNHFKHNSSAGSLSNNLVLSIYEDIRENLWIGTDGGGLNYFNKKTGKTELYKHHPTKNSIAGDYILALAEDDKNNLWIGTWGNGLCKFNTKTKEFSNLKLTSNNSEPIKNIYSLAAAKNGKIWIGTFEGGGIFLYDIQSNQITQFKHSYDDSKSLSADNIFTILEDKSDNIWVGTSDGGINLFEPKTNSFIHFNTENKNLINNAVYHLLETRSGIIYACTPVGLCYFDSTTRRFIQIESKNKFTSDYIYAALEDQKGNIWVSTNKGISKYNPETKVIKNYSVEDGLQREDFKPHSALARKSGELYFGGINGYNSFFPEQILEEPYNPPIVLTDFKLFTKSVPISQNESDNSPLKQDISETKSIRLLYDQSVITFEFASLDFLSPGNKVYAYMLEGFDKDWNIVGSKNSATYTNLNHGKYIFKVKSQNRSGEWSSQILQLDLTIVPPFWLTWWFKTLFLFLALAVPLGIVYWRTKRLRHQKEFLEKVVAERTAEIQTKNELLKNINSTKDKLFSIISHDLRSPFNTILGFQGLLLNSYDEFSDADRLEMIRQSHSTTNQAYYLVENLLNWARIQTSNIQYKPILFNLGEFFSAKFGLYRDIAEAKGISFNHQFPDNLNAFADVNLLETTLRNLINNAIKFTPVGGNILIKAGQENNLIQISVSDSGIGMSAAEVDSLFNIEKTQTKNGTNGEKGSGLGLILCKEFAEKNKGSITVESQPGKGSTFSFTLPATPRE